MHPLTNNESAADPDDFDPDVYIDRAAFWPRDVLRNYACESADPDDFDPQRYLNYALNWEQDLLSAGFKQRAGGEYEKFSRGKLRLVSVGPHTTQGSALVVTYYNSRGKWKNVNVEVVPYVSVVRHAKDILNEAVDPDGADADPDDIDPQRYIDTQDVQWVIVMRGTAGFSDTYYQSHSGGKYGGGLWIFRESQATRWQSLERVTAFFDLHLKPWYGSKIEIRPARLLAESDPDDIDPQRYLDLMADENAAQSVVARKELLARYRAAFQDTFMSPDLYLGDYREVSTRQHETSVIPVDVENSDDPDDYADYVEGAPNEVSEVRTGWLYRVSASGYMDTSDWGVADTEEEAIEALIEYFGDNADADAPEPDDMDESAGPDVCAVQRARKKAGGPVQEATDPDDIDAEKWISDLGMSLDRVRELLDALNLPAVGHRIGFSIQTSDQRTIEENALERGIELGDEQWETLNHDIERVEDNAMRWLEETLGEGVYPEGHDDDSLVGSLYINLRDPKAFSMFSAYMTHEEAWNTSSGTLPDPYAGTSELGALLDVSVELFDYAELKADFEQMEDEGIKLQQIIAAVALPAVQEAVLASVLEGLVSRARTLMLGRATRPSDVKNAVFGFSRKVDASTRWVERLSVESQLTRIFETGGRPLFREPRSAAQWSKAFGFGPHTTWVTVKVFNEGANAPSSLYTYEVAGRKGSEVVQGATSIMEMVETLGKSLSSLKGAPNPRVRDIVWQLNKPLG